MTSPADFRFFEKPIDPGTEFRHIYILESRTNWRDAGPAYDPATDLVLTYDFGLLRDVASLGGTVRYVDHLCPQKLLQENHFILYDFFRDWHCDKDGNDIFTHHGVGVGFSFRIDIWNDYTFYVRNRLCLEQLKTIHYQKIFVSQGLNRIEEVLSDIGLNYTVIGSANAAHSENYFFPIHEWMEERLHARHFRHTVRDVVTFVLGVTLSWYDHIADRFFPKKRIFIQEYHPTRKLLQILQNQAGIRVIQAHFSQRPGIGKLFRDRLIPIYGTKKSKQAEASQLLDAFRKRRHAQLILSTGVDASDAAYRLIEQRIASLLPERLRNLESVIRYIAKWPIDLEILIGNVGQLAMLIDSVAKSRSTPSYMIINGLMTHAYEDDAKYATVINSYSESIRDHYFRGMSNIVCLGDPRMDDYASVPARRINRDAPTITIGASGFSNIDLTSYLAIEFEFLYEILTAISNLTDKGHNFRVILKVRANGYASIYEQFIKEYFPGRVDEIVDQAPMRAVLDKTDFYISISSQTLFEASCLGIPCVYHKNDCENLDPPFDGKSELVTTYSVADLENAIADFLSGSQRFDSFLKKSVMEKYIGTLDGKNLDRNLAFIHTLLAEGYKQEKS